MDIQGTMIVLPAGHDPDSFVRKEGIEGLKRLLKTRNLSLIISSIMRKTNMESINLKEGLHS